MSPQPVAVLDLPVELCFGPSSLSAPGSSAFSLCDCSWCLPSGIRAVQFQELLCRGFMV